jgi:polyhydroxybutyrate depolymerase
VVVALILVVAVEAANHRDHNETSPTTSSTGTTLPGTGTSSPTTKPAPSSPAVTSACADVPQPPLPARGCILVSPPNVRPGERLPVVFVLHGFGGTAQVQRTVGHWDQSVVADRFIAAFPQGDFDSWNAGGCCALAKSTNINDVGYLQTLIDGLRQRPDVDPSKIFMVGESNGGMMTYRVLCQHADELAGAASSEGTSVAGCEPNAPIPLLHVHGKADTTVPYEGGQSLLSWALGVTFSTVPYSVGLVAKAEGCSDTPATTTKGTVTTETWTGCGTGGPVQLVSIDGWGHVWPTGAYDATTQMLKFFGLAS